MRDVGLPTDAELLARITREPGKCGGKPCIRGMRIRVIDILDLLGGGETEEQILADFPDLEPEDIRAAIAYARHAVDGLAEVA